MVIHNWKDVIAGLLLAAVCGLFLLGAMDLNIGTSRRMGPGYLPVALGIVGLALSLGILAQGLRTSDTLRSISWRPMLAVLAGVLSFGLAFKWLGLIPAVFLSVLVSALGDRDAAPVSTLAAAAVMAVGAWLIFRVGLNLPMPAFRAVL